MRKPNSGKKIEKLNFSNKALLPEGQDLLGKRTRWSVNRGPIREYV